jgi:uncharacterized membrane protein HdeD (DUF308 family)
MSPIDLASASAIFNEAMRDTVRRYRLVYLAQAGLMVLTGVLAIFAPVFASAAFVWLLGWLLIASGLVQGLSLLGARNHPSFWLQLIPAVLGILIGFLLLRDPGQGMVVITLLLIVFLMIEGIARLVFALTVRPLENWVWVLASGILGIVLSVVLLGSMPDTALWLIGLLLGVHLVAAGVSLALLVRAMVRAG